MTSRYRALLLDIGDVITAPVWDQLDELEGHIGRRLVGRGPLDPDGDSVWQQFLAHRISFYEYWQMYAAANGYHDWRDLFRELVTYLPHRFGDADAYRLMADARAGGLRVGVLTNDGVSIGGHDFFNSLPEFQALDAFIDARATGTAKPDPEPYLRAADALQALPSEVIFLDDMQMCIDGAHAVGMTGVLVDPLDKRPAFDHTRHLLGIG